MLASTKCLSGPRICPGKRGLGTLRMVARNSTPARPFLDPAVMHSPPRSSKRAMRTHLWRPSRLVGEGRSPRSKVCGKDGASQPGLHDVVGPGFDAVVHVGPSHACNPCRARRSPAGSGRRRRSWSSSSLLDRHIAFEKAAGNIGAVAKSPRLGARDSESAAGPHRVSVSMGGLATANSTRFACRGAPVPSPCCCCSQSRFSIPVDERARAQARPVGATEGLRESVSMDVEGIMYCSPKTTAANREHSHVIAREPRPTP